LAAKVGNGEITNSGRILEEMASRFSLFLPQGAQQISDDLTKAFCAKPIQTKQESANAAACALLHHPRYGSLFVKSNRIKENIYAEKPSFRHRSRFAISCRDHPSTGFGKLRSLHRAAQCRYVPDLLKLDGAENNAKHIK
jgi:hypothetical protein